MMRSILGIVLLIGMTGTIYGATIGAYLDNEKANQYTTNSQYDQALEAYSKALAKEADSPVVQRNLAHTFYKMGDYDKAKEMLQSQPEASVLYELGLTAIRQREFEEAKAHLMKKLLIDPSHMPSKQALEQLLKELDKQKKSQEDPKQDKKKENGSNDNASPEERQAQDEAALDKIRQEQQRQRDLRKRQSGLILKEIDKQEKEARKRFLLQQAPQKSVDKDW